MTTSLRGMCLSSFCLRSVSFHLILSHPFPSSLDGYEFVHKLFLSISSARTRLRLSFLTFSSPFSFYLSLSDAFLHLFSSGSLVNRLKLLLGVERKKNELLERPIVTRTTRKTLKCLSIITPQTQMTDSEFGTSHRT